MGVDTRTMAQAEADGQKRELEEMRDINADSTQGERYTTFLLDLELIDADRRLTDTGRQTRDELTLPIHQSLKDLAGELNPGGLDAAIREGTAEAAASPEPVAAGAPSADESEYEDVGPGAGPSPAAAPQMSAAMPAVPPPAGAPPTPPPDIWDTAAPDEHTRAYRTVTPDAVRGSDERAPAAPTSGPPPEPAPEDPPAAPAGIEPQVAQAPPAAAASTPGAAAAAPSAPSAPATSWPAEPLGPSAGTAAPPGLAAGAATVASPLPGTAAAFVSAAAIRGAAEEAGLRLPASLYAVVSAALAEGHVVLAGAAGSGKTTLALAIAKAAAQAGRSNGATVVTATHRWSAQDTVGRPGDEEWERGIVVDAAARGRWLIVDELDRARLDRALGALSSFLGGVPVTLPDGEAAPPE
jgi:hypothetical protein